MIPIVSLKVKSARRKRRERTSTSFARARECAGSHVDHAATRRPTNMPAPLHLAPGIPAAVIGHAASADDDITRSGRDGNHERMAGARSAAKH